VINTIAHGGEGVVELAHALERHWAFLERSGTLLQRRRARLRQRLVEIAEDRIRRRLWSSRPVVEFVESSLASMENGARNPFEVADDLIRVGLNDVQGNEKAGFRT
jgi:LAO/AO transport system kinase